MSPVMPDIDLSILIVSYNSRRLIGTLLDLLFNVAARCVRLVGGTPLGFRPLHEAPVLEQGRLGGGVLPDLRKSAPEIYAMLPEIVLRGAFEKNGMAGSKCYTIS